MRYRWTACNEVIFWLENQKPHVLVLCVVQRDNKPCYWPNDQRRFSFKLAELTGHLLTIDSIADTAHAWQARELTWNILSKRRNHKNQNNYTLYTPTDNITWRRNSTEKANPQILLNIFQIMSVPHSLRGLSNPSASVDVLEIFDRV